MMNSLVMPSPSVAGSVLTELFDRQRTLATYGFALLVIAILVVALQGIDDRTLDGVNIWVKPAKFLVSVAIFALTSAWFFGYVRPERRSSRRMRILVAALVTAASLELLYIAAQAAQGEASHFNLGSIYHSIMYAMMGIFAMVIVGTTLPLAWEIARRPAAGLRPDFVAAVVIGLVLTFILGAGLGGYMSAQPGHSVGAEGGRVALVGWNRSGGDLRIAHFLGIHAQQAIPVLAALVGGFAARLRWQLLIGGSALYVLVTLAVFAQAVAGRPLLPL